MALRLHSSWPETQVRIARQFLVLVAFCCAAVFCALAGSALAKWITAIDHPAAAMGVPARASVDAPAAADQRASSLEDASVHDREPAMDFYGNEVTDAMATYTLDPTGALYEEHSPETEVARLASPKS